MAKGEPPKSSDGDLLCSVCNEPWEAWSIRNLEDDWTRPQVAAFRAGLGCPGCLTDGELERAGNELLAKDRLPQVCDNCTTAAYDEGAFDPDDALASRRMQIHVCVTMGAEIADHICQDKENCACLCHPKTMQASG